MTDIKKLRELAMMATPWPKHFAVEDTFPTIWLVDKNGERHDIMNDDLIFWEAANPQAIIELLDRLERYERALRFYADRENWKPMGYKEDVKDVITVSDLGCKSMTDVADFAVPSGGRTAREALEGGK